MKNAAVSAGVPPTGSAASFSMKSRTSGALSAAATSALSLFKMAAGVAAGANKVYQFVASKPGTKDASGGTPGVLEVDFTGADGIYCDTGVCWSTTDTVNSIANAVAVYGNYLYI